MGSAKSCPGDAEHDLIERRVVLRLLAGTGARHRFSRRLADNESIAELLGQPPRGRLLTLPAREY